MSRFASKWAALFFIAALGCFLRLQPVEAQNAPAQPQTQTQAETRTGTLPAIRPGTCTMNCVNGRSRVTARENNPDTIRNDASCAARCQTVCATKVANDGTPFRCDSHSFEALAGGQNATPQANAGGGQTGSGAAQTLSSNTSCPGLNGLHDPFNCSSPSTIIGNIVKFLLAIAGALFLAMFVYGGAVWLTAGSSDRHEEARKTLINASAGVLVVIFSYTLVTGLVRLVGDIGVSQSNKGPVIDKDPATSQIQSNTPASANPGSGAGNTTCNPTNFTAACRIRCTQSTLVSLAGAEAQCNSYCDTFGPQVCTAVSSVSECAPACDRLCDSVASPLDVLCNSECSGLCAAAFPQ